MFIDNAPIAATVEALFGLPALTKRDGAAANLTGMAGLTAARTDCPTTVPDPVPAAAPQNAVAPGIAVAPASVVTTEGAAKKAGPPPVDETTAPIDGGNLPGFLHVVMKAEQEEQVEPNTKMISLDRVSTLLRTKADARTYLETNLERWQNLK